MMQPSTAAAYAYIWYVRRLQCSESYTAHFNLPPRYFIAPTCSKKSCTNRAVEVLVCSLFNTKNWGHAFNSELLHKHNKIT